MYYKASFPLQLFSFVLFQAFLYAVVLTIRAMFASQKSQTLSSLEIAKKNLPLLTMKQKLSTQEQEEWFSAIFRLCHSKATAK